MSRFARPQEVDELRNVFFKCSMESPCLDRFVQFQTATVATIFIAILFHSQSFPGNCNYLMILFLSFEMCVVELLLKCVRNLFVETVPEMCLLKLYVEMCVLKLYLKCVQC